MARILTAERQKLKQDAIRIRRELGWNSCQISCQLKVPSRTIRFWLGNNFNHNDGNNPPLKLNQVYVMDCVDGMARLPH